MRGSIEVTYISRHKFASNCIPGWNGWYSLVWNCCWEGKCTRWL